MFSPPDGFNTYAAPQTVCCLVLSIVNIQPLVLNNDKCFAKFNLPDHVGIQVTGKRLESKRRHAGTPWGQSHTAFHSFDTGMSKDMTDQTGFDLAV